MDMTQVFLFFWLKIYFFLKNFQDSSFQMIYFQMK